jgi:hypothetical protein
MGRTWYLVSRPDRHEDPGFTSFRTWLRATAQVEVTTTSALRSAE